MGEQEIGLTVQRKGKRKKPSNFWQIVFVFLPIQSSASLPSLPIGSNWQDILLQHMHALIWDKDISIALLFTPYLSSQQNFLEKKKATKQVKFSIHNYTLYKNKGMSIFN